MPFKEKFIAGAVDKGYTQKLAADMFDMIVPFADYGFNASHACAYGYVAYQTAYLMAHYPVEYMSAILTSVKDDKDRKPYYLYACRSMDIEVLPPDVNESETDFAPAPGEAPAIRYGLSAVRNVGEGAVGKIIEARRAGGAFTSFSDFCRSIDPGVLTKRVLESLVQAGAFDSLGYTRQGLLQSQDKVSGPILAERKAEAAGQFSLFGGGGDDEHVAAIDESVLQAEEFDKRTLLRLEKEMLGQFVTDHPLLEVREALAAKCSHEVADLDALGDGDLVTIGGIIGAVARKYTKRGEPYAQFRLEGLAGGVNVVAFPSVYEAVPGMIETDRIVLATGRIDLRGRELQIRATEVREPDLGIATSSVAADALVVDLPAAACTPSVLAKLKELFEANPGGAPVRVRFLSSTGVTPLQVGTYRVHPGAPLLGELHSLLGGDAARLERDPVDDGVVGRRRVAGSALVRVDVEGRAADPGAECANQGRLVSQHGAHRDESLTCAGSFEQSLTLRHEPRGGGGQHVARSHGVVRHREHVAGAFARGAQVRGERLGRRLHVVGAGAAFVRVRLDLPDRVGVAAQRLDQGHAIVTRDLQTADALVEVARRRRRSASRRSPRPGTVRRCRRPPGPARSRRPRIVRYARCRRRARGSGARTPAGPSPGPGRARCAGRRRASPSPYHRSRCR